MKFIKNKNCFLITEETFPDYAQLQEIRFQRDLENHMLYETSYLHGLVKEMKFQHRLDKYQSIGHKNLLFSFHTLQRLSILQAAGIHKDSHLNSIKEFVIKYGYLSVNINGGFCEYDFDENDIIEEYDFISDYILDNDTVNLVIENSGELEESLMKNIDSYIEPSHILNYKHIAREKETDSFIKSRNDWTLWIYTQGMDLGLYNSFLTAYGANIDQIMVKTSDDKLVSNFETKYPNINFERIGEDNDKDLRRWI